MELDVGFTQRRAHSPVVAALYGPAEEDPAAVAHAHVGAVVAVLPRPKMNTLLSYQNTLAKMFTLSLAFFNSSSASEE